MLPAPLMGLYYLQSSLPPLGAAKLHTPGEQAQQTTLLSFRVPRHTFLELVSIPEDF